MNYQFVSESQLPHKIINLLFTITDLVLLGGGDEAAVGGLLGALAAVVGDVREWHHQLVAVPVRLPKST